MTINDIIRMAEESGFGGQSRVTHRTKLLQFAEKIAGAERRECLKICHAISEDDDAGLVLARTKLIAQAIAARGVNESSK